MWSFLKPEPHRPLLSKEKIDPTYKRLRWQVFIGIFIGYAGYYLVRKNFSLAMPYLVDMGFDKGLLGVAISANAIAYGLSKFIMGGVSDRSSARKFLPLGLTLSALATLLLGTKVGVSSIVSMFILQFLIGWFQGMGWPPCGRVMTHWFSQNERGTKMSIWNRFLASRYILVSGGGGFDYCGYRLFVDPGYSAILWFTSYRRVSE